jgi:hypothetical protein
VRAAADADLGFDLGFFIGALRSHQRIDDSDFPEVGVPIVEVRAYFDYWADELDGKRRG